MTTGNGEPGIRERLQNFSSTSTHTIKPLLPQNREFCLRFFLFSLRVLCGSASLRDPIVWKFTALDSWDPKIVNFVHDFHLFPGSLLEAR